MENNELYHHGIKGMKWGVRRSKAQLARYSKRKEEDISDEELNDFVADSKRMRRRGGSFRARGAIKKEAIEKHGKEYADALVKKYWADQLTTQLVGSAIFATGEMAALAIIKKKAGL